MEKPFDLKELGQIIKEEAAKEGLTLAEEAVEALGKSVWSGTKRWVNESAALTDNKIDDVAAPFLMTLDSLVHESIEKVDFNKDGK